MVVPSTAEYFRQNMFGLGMPTIEQILPILFTRSGLFLLACLPIIVAWQGSGRSLFWRLGFASYMLVGFIYMLTSGGFVPIPDRQLIVVTHNHEVADATRRIITLRDRPHSERRGGEERAGTRPTRTQKFGAGPGDPAAERTAPPELREIAPRLRRLLEKV